jgi:hypothetical protein
MSGENMQFFWRQRKLNEIESKPCPAPSKQGSKKWSVTISM